MKKYLRIILAATLALFLCGEGHAARNVLQIKGSDTLINLVQRLSEVYMDETPGKYISVTGGGSGTGIAALLNGKCDIANASRLIKPKEVVIATEAGITPKRVVVAIDGLSIITNKKNPIKQLTVDEVGRIFRGEVTNWKEVGGENKPITLYGRQSNSGTFDFMVETVLKGDHSPRMRRMNGNAQIVEALNSDETGIGYVGVGYARGAEGVTILKIASNPGAIYGSPLNIEDVKSGKYPITRPLNQYVNGTPAAEVLDFIKFELSSEGQKIVEEEGFFPVSVSKEYADFNRRTLGL